MNSVDMVDRMQTLIQKQLETLDMGYVRIVCSTELIEREAQHDTI